MISYASPASVHFDRMLLQGPINSLQVSDNSMPSFVLKGTNNVMMNTNVDPIFKLSGGSKQKTSILNPQDSQAVGIISLLPSQVSITHKKQPPGKKRPKIHPSSRKVPPSVQSGGYGYKRKKRRTA